MKLVVLTGSPHRMGSTSLLADHFVKGAEAAGHEVFRFDAAFEEVHPCIACDKCQQGRNACIFADGMAKLNPHLLEADAVAFASPLYYYGLNAQLKAVIDRFYGNDTALRKYPKKAFLLMAAADDEPDTFAGAVRNYEKMIDYLKWRNCGKVLAFGCSVRADLTETDYPEQAYCIGRRLAEF